VLGQGSRKRKQALPHKEADNSARLHPIISRNPSLDNATPALSAYPKRKKRKRRSSQRLATGREEGIETGLFFREGHRGHPHGKWKDLKLGGQGPRLPIRTTLWRKTIGGKHKPINPSRQGGRPFCAFASAEGPVRGIRNSTSHPALEEGWGWGLRPYLHRKHRGKIRRRLFLATSLVRVVRRRTGGGKKRTMA